MPLGARPCKAYDRQDRGSAAERCLVERFTRVCQTGDVAAIVALLTGDISLTMPASAGYRAATWPPPTWPPPRSRQAAG